MAALQATYDEVQETFKELENDSQLADVIFRVGNDGSTKDIPAIGALFAAKSPYFRSLLYGKWRESQPLDEMAGFSICQIDSIY